jgi:hypothetical protein
MGIYRAKKALGVIDRVFKLMIYLGFPGALRTHNAGVDSSPSLSTTSLNKINRLRGSAFDNWQMTGKSWGLEGGAQGPAAHEDVRRRTRARFHRSLDQSNVWGVDLREADLRWADARCSLFGRADLRAAGAERGKCLSSKFSSKRISRTHF